MILRVMARCRYGKALAQRQRHRGHAGCVPAPVPDWLLAPGQTQMWGPMRTLSVERQGEVPVAGYKGGPGVSLGRLKGV